MQQDKNERKRFTSQAAYSVREFCEAHRIGPTLFYELKKKKKAPRVMNVGGRRLISVEEAKRWRAAQTASTEAND